MTKQALIVGVEGIIGSHTRDEMLAQGWSVVGIARRPSRIDHPSYTHVSVDLLDRQATMAALAPFTGLTHLVFAAYMWDGDLAAELATNVTLLMNSVEAAEAASSGLQHITLLEGGKWYGCHNHAFKTPAYEDDARVMPPIFYYNQEDYLSARQPGSTWTWSGLRPEGVGGVSVNTPLNFIQIAVIFAVLSKEIGIPLRFPGSDVCRDALYEMTDARLLGRSVIHVGTTAECAGEAYNVTNGDSFRWNQMFPHIADLLKMDYVGSHALNLTQTMADKAPVWDAVVAKHGLTAHPFEHLAFWPAGDYIFNQNWDNVRSIIKLRQTGFNDCIDSRQMTTDIVETMIGRGMIPRY